MSKIQKFFLTLTILVIIPILYLTFGERRISPVMTWGVSFSAPYAESLGLDWQATYLAILDELKVSHLRLSSYWNEIEKTPGQYDFSALDFMMENATSRGRKIILTLGLRQPRWPECHAPAWAEALPEAERQEKLLDFIGRVVERYRDFSSISAWQVENEFYVKWFGHCPEGKAENLEQEIALVRSMDDRPIILTDSGELSWWLKAALGADIFGTTMYRKVYAPWGATSWPYPPVYYSRLGGLVRQFARFERMIIAELQAEPWSKAGLVNDSLEENYATFSLAQFKRNLRYAQDSGINEAYLWGGEWWYYMKVKRGVEDYWRIAESLWQEF